MSPPPPPSDQSGPTVDGDPERAKPGAAPEGADPSAEEQPVPSSEADAVPEVAVAANAIPDHDPFTDTDVYPELSQRPSTGGFAGLSRSTGQAAAAYQSPYQPPYRSPITPALSAAGAGGWPTQPPAAPPGPASLTGNPAEEPTPTQSPAGFTTSSGPPDPGSAPRVGATAVMPVAAPSLSNPSEPPGSLAHQAAAPRPIGSSHTVGPPIEGSADAQRPPGAPPWSGPATPLTPPPVPPRPSRQGFGKGPLVTLGVVAGVVLLGLGALGGALLSNGNESDDSVEAASAAATTQPRTADAPGGSSGPTTRSQPLQTTTTSARTASTPTSTVPATTVTTTAASSADPNSLVADFRWTPDPPAAGQSITITDASTGNPNRWTWRWNGNTVSSSQPKGFTTSLREDTAITLTVCRGNGSDNCASVTKTITVN